MVDPPWRLSPFQNLVGTTFLYRRNLVVVQLRDIHEKAWANYIHYPNPDSPMAWWGQYGGVYYTHFSPPAVIHPVGSMGIEYANVGEGYAMITQDLNLIFPGLVDFNSNSWISAEPEFGTVANGEHYGRFRVDYAVTFWRGWYPLAVEGDPTYVPEEQYYPDDPTRYFGPIRTDDLASMWNLYPNIPDGWTTY